MKSPKITLKENDREGSTMYYRLSGKLFTEFKRCANDNGRPVDAYLEGAMAQQIINDRSRRNEIVPDFVFST